MGARHSCVTGGTARGHVPYGMLAPVTYRPAADVNRLGITYSCVTTAPMHGLPARRSPRVGAHPTTCPQPIASYPLTGWNRYNSPVAIQQAEEEYEHANSRHQTLSPDRPIQACPAPAAGRAAQ